MQSTGSKFSSQPTLKVKNPICAEELETDTKRLILQIKSYATKQVFKVWRFPVQIFPSSSSLAETNLIKWKIWIISFHQIVTHFTISVYGSSCNYIFFFLILTPLLSFYVSMYGHPQCIAGWRPRNRCGEKERMRQKQIIIGVAVNRNGKIRD